MKDFFKRLTGGSGKGKKKRRRRRREGGESSSSQSRSQDGSPKDDDTRRLQRKLEDNAQTMSIRRLQKYGLQSVRVIDANSIREIVESAVDEALRHRGADLSFGEREAVHDHVKARIMELVEENQRLSQEKTDQEKALEAAQESYHSQRDQLQDQLDTLRLELQERQRELQAELAAARQSGTSVVEVPLSRPAEGGGGAVEVMQQIIRKEVSFSDESFEAMEDRVGKLLKRLIETGELGRGDELELSNLEQALKETLTRVVADVKESEGADGGGRSEKVEMLELRIRKLNNALEEKEVALKKLAQHKGFVDDGIASIYDQIQGLSYEDPDFERKGELLKEVFDQNRELQEFMGNQVKSLDEPLDDAPAPAATESTPSAAPADDEPVGTIPSGDGGAGLQVPEGFAKPVEVDFGDVAF